MRTANCELANPKMRTGMRTAVRTLACIVTLLLDLLPSSHRPAPLLLYSIIMTIMIINDDYYC